jgi:hypothetical protein
MVLVEEFLEGWFQGFLVYDTHRKEYFRVYVLLLGIIADLPALADMMQCSPSTKYCLLCNEIAPYNAPLMRHIYEFHGRGRTRRTTNELKQKGKQAANGSTQFHTIPHDSTQFHTIPHDSTQFHTIPHDSTRLHTISHDFTRFHPHDSTRFHTIPHDSTRFLETRRTGRGRRERRQHLYVLLPLHSSMEPTGQNISSVLSSGL